MQTQTFSTKGAQTKAIKSFLGSTYTAKTNAAGTMVYGADLATASADLIKGGYQVINIADAYLLVAR